MRMNSYGAKEPDLSQRHTTLFLQDVSASPETNPERRTGFFDIPSSVFYDFFAGLSSISRHCSGCFLPFGGSGLSDGEWPRI